MFSGNLDSLAGALDEALNQKRRVVLVTYKATPKPSTQDKTFQYLQVNKDDGQRAVPYPCRQGLYPQHEPAR